MNLIYTANTRIPSEKAHPYQIVQMCEAFVQAGADVTLLYARRRNLPQFATTDIWGYYDIERSFEAGRVPVLDVYRWAESLPGRLLTLGQRIAAKLVQASYHIALLRRLAPHPDAIIYTRNTATAALVARRWPERAQRVFFEAHTYPATTAGEQARRWLSGRIGGWVVLTGHLRERYVGLGIPEDHIIVEHDGIREARFAIEGNQIHWREKLGWPRDAFVVGYLGRFVSGLENMDKGIGTLVKAVIQLAVDTDHDTRLALVGGPESVVDGVRQRIRERGLPDDFLLYPGMVPVEDVPGYLAAFDVCTIPSPWNDFFAYYTSPMKLFEYMAAGKPIVASDLPSTREVLTDGKNALLVPPSDVEALAGALRRLREDPALAVRLGKQAARNVAYYTWEARARRILNFVESRLAG